ncbi:uncharacterized protein LOC6035640 isoform X2 [Culex quinquefasciatus]|uniref:uncharacterized protein LOC6035640 isoform X2 n=1 Tax=Culex quinquefasciatus TaxID=7176 RepID=UPI0018E39453|nr:uncharacterized protein LOC6035640 isoform X2 [Culex quinquefasciatus]
MSGEMYDPARIAHYFQLVVAVQNKQLSQVKQLLSIALADINFINLYDRNRTLLHDAVASGDPAIVTLLLSHEPDTEIADLNGRKPFELSSELNPADKKAVDAVFRKHFRTAKRGGRLKPEEVVRSGDLCFTKRPGTAAVGQYYETKLLTMVLFRVLIDDRIVSFCMGNNLDEAGAFDDVVLRYRVRTGEPDRLVCLQAKHRDDKKRVEFKDLIDEKRTCCTSSNHSNTTLRLKMVMATSVKRLSFHFLCECEGNQSVIELLYPVKTIIENKNS